MSQYRKAIVGALIAGLSALVTALADNGLTAAEGVGAILAAVIAFGGVFGIRNAPALPARRASEPPEQP